MNPLTIFDIARFAPLIAVMTYAALKDFRTGEVPNKIWLYGIVGFALTIAENIFIFNLALTILQAISIAIPIATAFFAYYIGGWGGADVKAIIVLSVSAPLLPTWSIIWLFPLPLVVLCIAGISALVASAILFRSKTNVSFWKQKIRFLPFMLIGLAVCMV